jgi:integrase
MMHTPSMFDTRGQRKYLTSEEMEQLIRWADHYDDRTRSFCRFLAETGCRISEALAMRRERLNFTDTSVAIECLKKRRRGVFRVVPISPTLLAQLDQIAPKSPHLRIWPWARMTGWRRLRQLFADAGINGPQASPKGMRHGFAVAAVRAGVPLVVVQQWLGHADIRTTGIYTMLQGPEEREMAHKLRAVFLGAAIVNEIVATRR